MSSDSKKSDISGTDENFKEAMVYYTGIERPLDFKKALSLFRSSPSAFGTIMAAVMIADGKGLQKDDEQSKQLVADIGKEDLIFDDSDLSDLIKGLMYDYGLVFEKDPQKAFEHYLRAANDGNAIAQNNLAWAYDIGCGTAKSSEDFMNWILKAAQQGYPAAQRNLGWRYMHGICVERSIEEGVKWYTKAADNNYPIAQYDLAEMYMEGIGVERSKDKALELYYKAAMNGDTESQFALSLAYADEPSSIEEERLSVKWLHFAAHNGHKEAKKIIEEFTKSKEKNTETD